VLFDLPGRNNIKAPIKKVKTTVKAVPKPKKFA
jgi:hypothetical protein